MAKRTILVATDGSPAAEAAVEAGLDVALAMQATVRFIHADPDLADELYEEARDAPTTEQVLARDPVLGAAMGRARDRGVEAEAELVGISLDLPFWAGGRGRWVVGGGGRARG